MPKPEEIIQEIDRLREYLGLGYREFDALAGKAPGTWSQICARQSTYIYTLNIFANAVGHELMLMPLPERPNLRPHGTPAAMRRHRYHGEEACNACKLWDRERKRKARDIHRLGTKPVHEVVDKVDARRALPSDVEDGEVAA